MGNVTITLVDSINLIAVLLLQVAILNANYMVSRLKEHYKIVYTGTNGMYC